MAETPSPEPAAAGDSTADGHPPSEIGSRARRGLRSSIAAQLLTQLSSVVATIFLARLLTPREFGIVALSQSVLGMAALLSLGGVNAALLTRRDDVMRAASSLFWLAIMAGTAVVAVASLGAVPVTAALGDPDAAPYVAVLSMSFALDVAALVPNALLQRRLRFGWLNAAQVGGAIVYFVTEVVLAVGGLGAWSVVVGQVAGSVTGLVLALVGARWLPGRHLSLSAVRSDLRMTAGLSAGQIFGYLQKNADYWCVSRGLGTSVLGVYYVAYVIPNIVRFRVSTAIRQVLLPTFAAVANRERGAEIWLRTLPLTIGVAAPALIGLAATADLVVRVFFGPTWAGAVTPMRILTIATLADLVITSVGALAVARRMIRPHVTVLGVRASATALFCAAAVVLHPSTTSVAWGVVAAAAVTLGVQHRVLSRRLGIRFSAVRGQLWAYAVACLLMVVAVRGASALLSGAELPAAVELAVLVVMGAIAYIGIGLAVFGRWFRPLLAELRRTALGR